MDDKGNVFVSKEGLQVFLFFKLSGSAVEPPGFFFRCVELHKYPHILPRLSMIDNRQFSKIAG
jgi:hypothetical protein